MRTWLSIALLAASWLFGLSYYQAANPSAWAMLIAAGTLLLWNATRFAVPWRESVAAVVALCAGLLAGLWPFDMAAIEYVSFLPLAFLAVGFAFRIAATAPEWAEKTANTLTAAGLVLLMQLVALFGYEVVTARSHDLPPALAAVVGGVAKLLSFDASTFDSTVAMHSMRELHRLGATWELLVDPTSLAFWVGGLAFLVFAGGHVARTDESLARHAWNKIRPALTLSAVVAFWLPVRAGVLMAIYMHIGLRLEFEDQPDAMILFWQPWLHGVLLLVPALLAWRLVRPIDPGSSTAVLEAKRPPAISRRAAAMALASLAAIAAGFGLWWDPIGERKPGRVLVDELHIGHNPRTHKTIHWEPTTRPYDTEWYGQDAAYNYACIYDYLTHFYNVRRLESKSPQEETATADPHADSLLTDRITSAALRDCDVLMLKIPTADFTASEVEAIKRFVKRGGGLLLIGEHTDVFGTGRHLNSLAHEFGFAFRYDCLFGIDHVASEKPRTYESRTSVKTQYAPRPKKNDEPPSVFDQHYRRPWVPHPVLQDMPFLDFATSASIDPGASDGRAVIRSTGLWSLPADYHADNYYPQVTWRPDMRYGAFVQLWSTRHGEGRVLAFTDSTIFSNFSAFQPGKAELMLGMIEWLNHRNAGIDPRPWLFAIAALAAAGAIFAARGSSRANVSLIAMAAGAFLLTAPVVRAIHHDQMPTPPADESKITRVVFDRTVSGAWLPNGSFIDGRPYGFGIFERWMLRLGYFGARGVGDDALAGDLLVIANPGKPGKPVTPRFRQQLAEYVEGGGKLLVLDSTAYELSTANDLLKPFGISLEENDALDGTLINEHDWPSVPVAQGRIVRGGTPLFHVAGQTVGSSISYGNGTVVVLGCGDRFTDANMGVTGDTNPDAEMRKVYDLQFELVRWIIEGESHASLERNK